MSRPGIPVMPPDPQTVDSLFAPTPSRRGGNRGQAGGSPMRRAGTQDSFAPQSTGSSPVKSVRSVRSARSAARSERSQAADPRSALELTESYAHAHHIDTWDRLLDGFCDSVGDEVLIHREADENLAVIITKAQQKLAKASDVVTALMALGLFVSEICGRSGWHAADLEARCSRALIENRDTHGRLLLGYLLSDQINKKKSLGAGLSRHRALVFKLLTDTLGVVDCTVERLKVNMTAWNTVTLGDKGYVVDLMHDPGALYEAGSAKQQEYVKMLGAGFGGLEGTLSNQKELPGKVPRPAWHVEATDLVYGRGEKDRLGKGGFGEVLKGTWADATVAIKLIKDTKPTDYDVLDFVLEIALLSRLNHPNVMRFWRGCAAMSEGKRRLLMVTEHIEKGGLSGLIHGHGGQKLRRPFTLPQVLVLALGIARGMQYLHACKVLHLDLKSPNVLIDLDWTPKLCDFGLAKISMQDAGNGLQTTLRGVSPIWAPPEMFDDHAEAMTDKADVYSMGIVFYELACWRLPFQDISQRQLPRAKYEGMLPTIPREVPEDFAAIVKSCCAHKLSARPSMGGVVARIIECASSRSIDVVCVEMPSWDGRSSNAGQDQEILEKLRERHAQLQRERRELQAQVQRTREQRLRLQQMHCGGGPIAVEGVVPQLHSSPRSVRPGRGGGNEGSPAAGRPLSSAAGAALEGSKQLCCTSQ